MWDHLKRVSLGRGREANKNDEEEEEAASKEEVLTRVTQISYCCSRVSPVLKKIRKINCHKVATVDLSPPLSLSRCVTYPAPERSCTPLPHHNSSSSSSIGLVAS
jgi:hypothetical protein